MLTIIKFIVFIITSFYLIYGGIRINNMCKKVEKKLKEVTTLKEFEKIYKDWEKSQFFLWFYQSKKISWYNLDMRTITTFSYPDFLFKKCFSQKITEGVNIMKLNAIVCEKISKKGSPYICVEVYLTDKIKKLVFLTQAEVELVKMNVNQNK